MARDRKRRLATRRRLKRAWALVILAIPVSVASCASGDGSLRIGGHKEYLVVRPFRVLAEDVPDGLAALEAEMSSWLEARPAVWRGDRSNVEITADGGAVVAWTETFRDRKVLECRVWKANDAGEWKGRAIELDARPWMERSSESFLFVSGGGLLDIREDPASNVDWPEGIRYIGLTPNGRWVGEDDKGLLCGTIQNGELRAEFSSDGEPGLLPDARRISVAWLYDYEVGILAEGGKSAIVDFVDQTIRPLQFQKWILDSIGHPAGDRFLCAADKGYVIVKVSRDGEVEEIRSNWSVQTGDQLWASSPSGAFIGGRRTSLANLVPGGYGPNVIRVNRDVAPAGTRRPNLNGSNFVGWLRVELEPGGGD